MWPSSLAVRPSTRPAFRRASSSSSSTLLEATSEAHHAERRGDQELELVAILDPRLRLARQVEGAVDGRPERGDAEVLQRHPELQGAAHPRELDAAVGEVHLPREDLRILQVIRCDLERFAQVVALAHQQTPALERLVEPLVRVERHRVGQLHPRSNRLPRPVSTANPPYAASTCSHAPRSGRSRPAPEGGQRRRCWWSPRSPPRRAVAGPRAGRRPSHLRGRPGAS